MTRPIIDINHRDYFSDENMEALEKFAATDPVGAKEFGIEPASYSDWELGPGEDSSEVRIKSRPVGDNSYVAWQDEINEGTR